MRNNVTVRKAKQGDHDFIKEMFYDAIFIPEGVQKPPCSIIYLPELLKYTVDWMKQTDIGFIAEMSGQKVGVIWTRLFDNDNRGYGFVRDDMPELSMAVKDAYRNKGIGKALLDHVFDELKRQGYDNVSLSVDQSNRAVNIYKKVGFIVFKAQSTDFVMVKHL
ncbi:MAG: GNAT family N-acetyltransferase [Bacillota bacterium]|nr:GNAT family N-acetyltransferase [Bacillota bacterium]